MRESREHLVQELASLKIDRESVPKRHGLSPFVLWGGVSLAILIAIGIGMTWRSRSTPPPAPIPEVAFSPLASPGSLLTTNGYVISRNKAALSFARGGKIRQVFVGEGDAVKKGQILATLENLELKALRQDAQRDFERKKALFQENLISQKEFEDAETRRRVAEARWEDTMIRAPFSGVVLEKLAEVGEMASALGAAGSDSQGVLVMADLKHLSAEVDINETNLAQIHKGTAAEIIPDAFPDRIYKGRLTEIRPTADRAKATVRVKVVIENPDGKLLPEMGVRVNFLERKESGP